MHFLELLGIDERIILKKRDGIPWTGFMGLQLEKLARCFEHVNELCVSINAGGGGFP
jgi:hypothetical protein